MHTITPHEHSPILDLTEESQIAIANSGHAIVALAAGLHVNDVSPLDVRDVDLAPLPPLSKAVSYPPSIPTEVVVRLLLAGERAVASVWHDPKVARLAQFKPAARIARQVLTSRLGEGHPVDRIDADLDRHRERLDRFFAEPEHARHLEWVADMAMMTYSTDDDSLHLSLFGGRCGALSDDGRYRCNLLPHHGDAHMADTFGRHRRVTWAAIDV